MFFRNLTMFRFPAALDLSELETRLAEFPMKPVGPLEVASRGFVPPLGVEGEELTHRGPDGLHAIWLTLGGEQKILPGPVVNELMAKRVAELEKAQGRKPGGKTRKQMREDLVHELLPRAFVKPVRTDVLIDLRNSVVVVNTASRKAAENAVSEIRTALGSFPALPLNAEVSPRGVMTGWIAGEPLPEGLTIGEQCELKDPSDHGATVRCTNQDMGAEEIARHLDAGKQVTKLGLNLDGHVSFVLGEDLIVRQFKLLDGALDRMDRVDNEDLRGELDARFALMVGEFNRLFAVLEPALKLSRAE